jgi:hypothetical protein
LASHLQWSDIRNAQNPNTMKNYLMLAMILLAGLTAYPQATRSARESKSEKSSAKKETVNRSATKSEKKATGTQREVSRQSDQRNRVETKSSDRNQETRSNNESVKRSQEATRSNNESVRRSQEATRSNNESAKRSQEATRSNNESVRRSQEATRSNNESARVKTGSEGRVESGNAERRQSTVIKSENRSGSQSGAQREVRDNRGSDDRDIKVNTSSASRIYRESRGSLTRDDGKVIRHQNDDVFRSNKYKLNYDNYENLRRSDEFRRDYRDYDNWNRHRHIRVVNHYHYRYVPVPWEVRRTRYYYRVPNHIDLIWTPLLFHRFMFYYPTHRTWDMEFGSQISTISAYEAQEYAGTVSRVYGKVDEVYYSPEDENYILYVGAPFPYHDVSVVIPRHIARDISMSPKWYFENEYIWVVGLINMWEGKPEIVIRDEDQIRKY